MRFMSCCEMPGPLSQTSTSARVFPFSPVALILTCYLARRTGRFDGVFDHIYKYLPDLCRVTQYIGHGGVRLDSLWGTLP